MASPIGTDFSRISSDLVASPQGAPVIAEVTGNYGGEAVRVSSETEKLAAAAEELGMAAAHRADKKTLNQREIRQGRAANREALSRIADYLDELPDMPEEVKLQGLVEELEQFLEQTGLAGEGGKTPTKDDVFAALGRFDPDVSHQFAALDIIAEYFAGIDASLDAAIEDAKREFEQDELAREVRAGIAAAKLAHDAAQTLESDPAVVRDAYRKMLREKKHMGQLFDDLASFDILKKFEETVELFLETAGRDLASAGPSTDPRFLDALLTELGKLKKLNTVYRLSGQQLERVKRLIDRHESLLVSAQTLTSQLLHFCSKPSPSVADAMVFGDVLANASPQTLVHYANALKALYELVPDDVLPGVQARQFQNEALLAWMTRLAEREEAAINATMSASG